MDIETGFKDLILAALRDYLEIEVYDDGHHIEVTVYFDGEDVASDNYTK